ncbi:MAG: transglutaminase domain-containing protein [Janthinobacterium lividum]
MQQFLAFVLLLLLPAGSWAQQRLAKAPTRPAATKAIETVQARYARLDQFAQQLPDAQATSLSRLAAALATQARTEDDKARLIFAWVAQHIAYDVAYLNGDTTRSYGPEQVLQSRVAICQGYADLFTDLAIRMGLTANTVTGYAAVDATQPVCPMLGTDGAHAWNVYRAAGTVHIADPCWGAGFVSSDYQCFTHKLNSFWFDTSPAQAIFLHFPSDDSWQLLPTPVASTVFRQWPYVEATWFRLGVSGASMAQALAITKGRPKPKPLPMVYPTSHQVQIVKVPRQATLVAGQPVTFVFAVAPGVELGFESNE